MRILRSLLRYLILTPVLGAFGAAVLWFLGFVSFVVTISVLSPMKPDLRTDGIVALTGGAERVKTALDLLQKGLTYDLLISGVHKAADLRDLLVKAHMKETDFPCCVTLGFQAYDTVGNARETAEWVDRNHIRTLRVVTANYHMPRAWLEMRRALPGVKIIVHPVKPSSFDLFSKPGAILVFSEYNKTIVAAARWGTLSARRALGLPT